jgi:hypothetical protein
MFAPLADPGYGLARLLNLDTLRQPQQLLQECANGVVRVKSAIIMPVYLSIYLFACISVLLAV